MNIFFEEHRKIIKSLLSEGVEFILIGGYAVNYHGYNRTTGDMDIWLKPDNANKTKVIDALQKKTILTRKIFSKYKRLILRMLWFLAHGKTPIKLIFLPKFQV